MALYDVQGPPNKDVVDVLEDMLAEAKAGRIVALAIVGVRGAQQNFQSVSVASGGDVPMREVLLGGMETLKHRMMNHS